MSDKKNPQHAVKIQITLPKGVVEKIESEVRSTYTKKSMWFLMLVEEYFKNKENRQGSKAIIKLDL